MTIQAATPYFILNGHARDAIAFYEKGLGAKAVTVQRFGDLNQSCPEAQKDLVMHAELKLDGVTLFLSDGPSSGELAPAGAVHVTLNLDDEAQAHRCFDALSAGGKVVQALFDAPWGGLFGAVDDRFGIPWMFTCAKKS